MANNVKIKWRKSNICLHGMFQLLLTGALLLPARIAVTGQRTHAVNPGLDVEAKAQTHYEGGGAGETPELSVEDVGAGFLSKLDSFWKYLPNSFMQKHDKKERNEVLGKEGSDGLGDSGRASSLANDATETNEYAKMFQQKDGVSAADTSTLVSKESDSLPNADPANNSLRKRKEMTLGRNPTPLLDSAGSMSNVPGGGMHLLKESQKSIMQTQEEPLAGAEPSACLIPDGNLKIDYTRHLGSDDAPGVPNLEYLGLGYNLLEGNPRGTSTSELDPGFRFRVLQLEQLQSNATVDGAYTVPLGTEIKYTSSCSFDDSSFETSSADDMREAYSKEVKYQVEMETQASGGINFGLFRIGGSIARKQSFSFSELFQQQRDKSFRESFARFEARAMCSEFEASFVPGYKHKRSPEYNKMLEALPSYDNKDTESYKAWKKFIDTYGTHYVKNLILGGKRTYSTKMSQADYAELTSESVEVGQTLSYSMSAALSASASVKAGMIKAAAKLAQRYGGAQGAALGSVVNVALAGTDDNEEIFGANFNAQSSTALSNFASTRTQASDAHKIAQKRLTTSEFLMGGVPSEDWHEWAESVRDKPMPISYELGSLMEFMSEHQKEQFMAAAQDIYGYDTSQGEESVAEAFRYGLFSGPGDPLTIQSSDPNNDGRLMMRAIDGGSENILSYVDVWKGKPNKPVPFFATPVRQSIAPNKNELSQPLVNDNLNDNHLYYATSRDANSNGILAVTSFGAASFKDLPRFSFLTINSLTGRFPSLFHSGVVSNDGTLSTLIGRREFSVTVGENDLSVKFAKVSTKGVPTVLVFPHWFSDDNTTLPEEAGDLASALNSIGPTHFNVQRTKKAPQDKQLGFNFAVFGSDMPPQIVKHGVIYECTDHFPNYKSSVHGVFVSPTSACSDIQNMTIHNGVKVQFESPFFDIPSVVVSPLLPLWDGMTGTPRCMVESITESSARVKCALVGDGMYKPIPFTFAALGSPNYETPSRVFVAPTGQNGDRFTYDAKIWEDVFRDATDVFYKPTKGGVRVDQWRDTGDDPHLIWSGYVIVGMEPNIGWRAPGSEPSQVDFLSGDYLKPHVKQFVEATVFDFSDHPFGAFFTMDELTWTEAFQIAKVGDDPNFGRNRVNLRQNNKVMWSCYLTAFSANHNEDLSPHPPFARIVNPNVAAFNDGDWLERPCQNCIELSEEPLGVSVQPRHHPDDDADEGVQRYFTFNLSDFETRFNVSLPTSGSTTVSVWHARHDNMREAIWGGEIEVWKSVEGPKTATAVRLSKFGRQTITLNRVWISCLGGDADFGQVSKGAAATQSSTNGIHVAEEALSAEGYSYTLQEDNPWWKITLGGNSCVVSHVEINDLGLVGLTVSLLNEYSDTIAEKTITEDMVSRPSPGDGSQRPYIGALLDFSDTPFPPAGRAKGNDFHLFQEGDHLLTNDSVLPHTSDSLAHGFMVVLPGKDKVLALRAIQTVDSNGRTVSSTDLGVAEGSNPGFGTLPSYPINYDIFVSYYSEMQDDPWWKTTFQKSFDVKEINIYKGLCDKEEEGCANRPVPDSLIGAEVHLLDSCGSSFRMVTITEDMEDDQFFTPIYNVPYLLTNDPVSPCQPTSDSLAHGFMVVLPGKDKVLALRSIQTIDSNGRTVIGTDLGVAEGSNPGFGTLPSYPINYDISFSYYSEMQDDPWWKTTFQKSFVVKEINIYKGLCDKEEEGCANRPVPDSLIGAEVHLLDSCGSSFRMVTITEDMEDDQFFTPIYNVGFA